MKFVIRVDSSIDIGSGHVMRCLVLANSLKKKSSEVYFICREHYGNLIKYIETSGYKVYKLPQNKPIKNHNSSEKNSPNNWLGVSQEIDAIECKAIIDNLNPDWLIVDHYFIDRQWELILKKNNLNIMVIDDLANRKHHCELLLDQNYYIYPKDRYKNLLPHNCNKLLGPRFALLREEFVNFPIKKTYSKDNKFHVFIFMGSADKDNQTLKAINSVIFFLEKGELISADVLVGSINMHSVQIELLCKKYSEITFYKSTNRIAELMSKADISIGAGGSSSIERCYLGLPSLVISLAENQVETTNALDSIGAICHLGWFEDVDEKIIITMINKLMNNKSLLKSMELKAISIFDFNKNKNKNKNKNGIEYIADLLFNKSLNHKKI
ncbi:MAG: UDP-2,4-diacetamido-2,4,6-trideoxy-beta-L-altropyranose hydrolase [Pseudomonadota bacterium]|nr:UDP-2,4-diacetamido-2,4,6-trideoxy-beta-L-altropyranose hydrolase [Pseudomonadota bacterium]